MTWWQRLHYWLTHAGQWSAPEWNLTPDPNEGPPWPDSECKLDPPPKEGVKAMRPTDNRYAEYAAENKVLKKRDRLAAHRLCAREVLLWANKVNGSGANLSGEQVAELMKIITVLVEADRQIGEG